MSELVFPASEPGNKSHGGASAAVSGRQASAKADDLTGGLGNGETLAGDRARVVGKPQSEPSDKQKKAIARALRKKVGSTDRGEIDPLLAKAMAKVGLEAQLKAIVAVLPQARLLLPVYPQLNREESEVANQADMAATPDQATSCPPSAFTEIEFYPGYHAQAVPVYSQLSQLCASHPQARPIPVQGRLLALSVLQRPGRLLLDDRFLLPHPALNAIAAGDKWLPAWENDQLLARLEELCDRLDGVHFLALTPRPSGPDTLLVRVAKANPQAPRELLRLQQELPSVPGLAQSADGMMVTPVMQ